MPVDITQSPVITLALHGYHPFTPDANIFAGGYQGPLYPNPTTLILDTGEFNPRPFQDAVATEYRMKNDGDIYAGIGIGNPGINYRNPGHVLGLIDTYSRMSYGLRIIKALRDEEIGSSFGEAVPIIIQFNIGENTKNIGSTDLYPIFADTPDVYISEMVDNGLLILDPRTDEPFIFDGTKYQPNTEDIDLFDLFNNVKLDSYFGMPQQFRLLFANLTSFISDFDTEVSFVLDRPQLGGVGSLVETMPFPLPLTGVCEDFSYHPEAIVEFDIEDFSSFQDVNYCKQDNIILDETTSLQIMTGDPNFHDGQGQNNEYRSLTELNSIVNLVPVNIIAARYWFDISQDRVSSTDSWPFGGVGLDLVNFIICDIVLTSHISQEININGTASIESPLTIAQQNELQFFSNRHSCREIAFISSMTNSFTWDRGWFGLTNNNVTDMNSIDFWGASAGNYNSTVARGFSPVLLEDQITTLNFNETFQTGPGATTIRSRLAVQSKMIEAGGALFEKLTIDLNIQGNELNLNKSMIIGGAEEGPADPFS